jgi:hypothetical protein
MAIQTIAVFHPGQAGNQRQSKQNTYPKYAGHHAVIFPPLPPNDSTYFAKSFANLERTRKKRMADPFKTNFKVRPFSWSNAVPLARMEMI